MEVKEAERTAIAKPVASRPTCSSLRSFSEILVGTINASPSQTCSETAVTAIRPKTMRFKPTMNCVSAGVFSSPCEVSGAAVPYMSDKVMNSDTKSSAVVYKPLAKLVSKTNVSLLTNLGNSNIGDEQVPTQFVSHVHPTNQVNHHFRSEFGHQNFPSQSESERTIEPSKVALENLEDEQKNLPPSVYGDRPSYDGYNWRKYGQKQVKGSEYPRSYYKCTYPNCPVKKKVERSLDGQIAEIVYKGEHNHSKPQPQRRSSSGPQGQGVASDGTGQDTNSTLWSNQLYDRNEVLEGRIEYQNEVGLSTHSSYLAKAPLSYDRVTTGAFTTGITTSDNSFGLSADFEEGSKGMEAEGDDEPKSKRRRNKDQSTDTGVSGEGIQEPYVMVQNSTDSEVLGDGFRWRKYGQKVVKGNPYPRSYYRCTSLKCNVRKHVERASDDPRAFITTYEGTHNHEMPIKNVSSMASEPDSQVVTLNDKP